ncbi:acyl homoserine lactone synthase [Methylacidimicrobium cyclopophantes]|uniref:Acyl homoserine lactone synthase n=1 Tax=Methylacidimicrobium cyclopophantes TaxID=1041766 RepID=A0A5E6MH25_9BACT|nr:acyl-homoserine-lactone synthase [Methylacidimicrobium cyclopophantes]VVM08413.1 acyl homoserine lactone synthase [Methylacidimicrobium cyclopophantes]
MDYQTLHLHEQEFCIRTLTSETEKELAYRFRYRIFCRALRWISPSAPGIDRDQYDDWATLLGVFDESSELRALVHILPPTGPFMLESDFAPLLAPEHSVRKAPDTIELTRFAVDPSAAQIPGLSQKLSLLLYKGLYHWCQRNVVRYAYLVVEKYFFRAIQLAGFPCRRIGPLLQLPPANVESLAGLFDMNFFLTEARTKRPQLHAWLNDVDAQSARCSIASATA